jgi:hypothetical protein
VDVMEAVSLLFLLMAFFMKEAEVQWAELE